MRLGLFRSGSPVGGVCGVVLWVVASACSSSPSPQPTQSLLGASDVSFVCVFRPDTSTPPQGLPLSDCPQAGPTSALWALLTQPETGEVAVVDMGQCAEGSACAGVVEDVESTQPGANFLQVGAEPVSIVSTPGGLASFVAVAEPGREGIYGLPTECIGQRPDAATFRDIRSWPACRLPAAPGEMVVFSDLERSFNCSGDEGTVPDRVCAVDLAQELPEGGRLKLAVALPSLGSVAFIDAQDLLALPPGQFSDCPLEGGALGVPLAVELDDSLQQELPEDLAAGECTQPLGVSYAHAPYQVSVGATPADMDVSEGQLFVADRTAPVVHRLSVRDACAPVEEAPLYPRDVLDPEKVVPTSRLAVSPRTFSGERFLYAVDQSAGATAGTLMAFDVTTADGPRTPIVRPRSSQIDDAPPDRIVLPAPVSDITFARHDVPVVDPRTSIAVAGVACDPDPASATRGAGISLGTLYRKSDDNLGPHPRRLRGVFGFAALHNGLVTTIDVEDLDAPCRRPAVIGGDGSLEGCDGSTFDGQSLTFENEDGDEKPYVTRELSCNIALPHRPRLSTYYRHDRSGESGGTAPSIRAFPLLSAEDGSSLAVDQSERGRRNPKLVAVNRTPGGVDADGRSVGDAEARIAGALFRNRPGTEFRLEVDPAKSERNSLLLSYAEPRVYAPSGGTFTATYEGVIRASARAPFEVALTDDLVLPDVEQLRLEHQRYGVIAGGSQARYCAAGVEDETVMLDRGLERLAVPPALGGVFAGRHADFVQLDAELLPEDDRYWTRGAGKSCGEPFGEEAAGLSGRDTCELFFGESFNRELTVVRAFNDRLLVEPRFDNQPREVVLDMVECCFPEGVDYRIRVGRQWVVLGPGGLDHDVIASAEAPFACERSCSPLLAGRNGRAFEVSCNNASGGCVSPGSRTVAVGSPEPREVVLGKPLTACVLSQHPAGGVQPGGPGGECIYAAATARFAIYRGAEPSRRNMQFVWDLIGGVSGQNIDLLRLDGRRETSAPRAITYLPAHGQLVVSDGGSTSMAIIGLNGSSTRGLGFVGSLVR